MSHFMMNLKNLNYVLKEQNKSVFGDIRIQIHSTMVKLQQIQNKLLVEGFSKTLFDEEVYAYSALDTLLSLQEKMRKDQCCIKWLKDGD